MPKAPALAPRRLAAALLALAATAAEAQPAWDLVSDSAFRVCADPAGWPASREDGAGYENRIADLIAEELGKPVEYTWYPMTTGFIRRTLAAKECDVVIGYAQGAEMIQNTNHWMTSAFVLIVPGDSDLADVTELSDPRLKGRRIGIIAGTQPATHMAAHGLIGDAKSYPLFVDTRYDSPPARMLDDLEAGEIDAAILWGPMGGPLAKADHPDFVVTPLIREEALPRLYYRITMGVRPGEDAWKRELNSLIRRNQDEIDRILIEAGVPILTDMGTELKTVE
jgi:quinoprotein dehydrogenase-associated probable ABC transporter substrate-binding protein